MLSQLVDSDFSQDHAHVFLNDDTVFSLPQELEQLSGLITPEAPLNKLSTLLLLVDFVKFLLVTQVSLDHVDLQVEFGCSEPVGHLHLPLISFVVVLYFLDRLI